MPISLCCFLSVALLLCARPSCAQAAPAKEELAQSEESGSENAVNMGVKAVELGHRGLKAYGSGDYRAALVAFSEAERLVHSPVFVLYQGRCQRELGAWLEARELLKSAASAEEKGDMPLAWQRAQQEALVEWAALERMIPRLQVRVQGEFEPPLRLSVDGEALELREGQASCEALPGEHTVTVIDARGQRVEQRWHAATAQRKAFIALVFPPPRITSAPVLPAAPPQVSASSPLPAQKKGAYIAWGFGGAGLLYGVVVGAVALGKAQGVKSRCDGSQCQPEDEAVAERAKALGRMATAGVAVGLVSAATGTLLFFTVPQTGARAQVGLRGSTLLLNAEF